MSSAAKIIVAIMSSWIQRVTSRIRVVAWEPSLSTITSLGHAQLAPALPHRIATTRATGVMVMP